MWLRVMHWIDIIYYLLKFLKDIIDNVDDFSKQLYNMVCFAVIFKWQEWNCIKALRDKYLCTKQIATGH